MWIRIKSQEGPNFSIPVPLALAGSRFIWRMLEKMNGYGCSGIMEYAPYAHEIVRELRRYVRRNGHFTLVDVEDSEGDRVTITV